MKIFSFSSILLTFVVILSLVNVIVTSWTIFKMTGADTPTCKTDPNHDVQGVSAVQFWTERKIMLLAPPILNVVSMVLLGVLFVMN